MRILKTGRNSPRDLRHHTHWSNIEELHHQPSPCVPFDIKARVEEVRNKDCGDGLELKHASPLQKSGRYGHGSRPKDKHLPCSSRLYQISSHELGHQTE